MPKGKGKWLWLTGRHMREIGKKISLMGMAIINFLMVHYIKVSFQMDQSQVRENLLLAMEQYIQEIFWMDIFMDMEF